MGQQQTRQGDLGYSPCDLVNNPCKEGLACNLTNKTCVDPDDEKGYTPYTHVKIDGKYFIAKQEVLREMISRFVRKNFDLKCMRGSDVENLVTFDGRFVSEIEEENKDIHVISFIDVSDGLVRCETKEGLESWWNQGGDNVVKINELTGEREGTVYVYRLPSFPYIFISRNDTRMILNNTYNIYALAKSNYRFNIHEDDTEYLYTIIPLREYQPNLQDYPKWVDIYTRLEAEVEGQELNDNKFAEIVNRVWGQRVPDEPTERDLNRMAELSNEYNTIMNQKLLQLQTSNDVRLFEQWSGEVNDFWEFLKNYIQEEGDDINEQLLNIIHHNLNTTDDLFETITGIIEIIRGGQDELQTRLEWFERLVNDRLITNDTRSEMMSFMMSVENAYRRGIIDGDFYARAGEIEARVMGWE